MPADRHLWLNVVSNRSHDGATGRRFWVIEFDDERDALDDAADYPRIGRLGGPVHYVETIKVRIGDGFDILEQEAENRRSLRTWLPRVPA